MKQVILNTMLATGAFAPFRAVNRSRALILMYHRFDERDVDGTLSRIPASNFAEHLDYLAARYRVVPLSVIADCVKRGQKLPSRAAAITIDDGYADAYRVAFPALRERKLPATLFVTTGFVDRQCWLWTDKMRYVSAHTSAKTLEVTIGERELSLNFNGVSSRYRASERMNAALKALPDNDKEAAIDRVADLLSVEVPSLPPPEYEAITWKQAREMDAACIEVASHTVTHPILTHVDDSQLESELRGSKLRLESELGHRVNGFCYPNGGFDERVRQQTELAGYEYAVTVQEGFNDPARVHPLALKRIPAGADLAHFVQSTSGFEEVKAKLRRRAHIVADSEHSPHG